MSRDPLVSVVMPVYNGGRYLAAAVESILEQTFTEFEFIITNDGSTDRSLAILEGYASQDPRIRLISRPNTGLVVALNEMIDIAQGEFIARMDADDVAMPERFERQIDYLREHPEVVVLSSSVTLIDPEGLPIGQWEAKLTHEHIEGVFLSGFGRGFCHPATMIRRDALNTVGGYREQYFPAEDMDLWLRLGERGRLANVPEVLLHHRQHPASICASQHVCQVHAKRRVLEAMAKRRGCDLPSDMPGLRVPERPSSLAEQYERFLWSAWRAGYARIARKYAWQVLLRRPFRLAIYRLLLLSLMSDRAKDILRRLKRLLAKPVA